jgi:hypothetical protein
MFAPFRITITGEADAVFIAALIEDVKKITPEAGGFTFEYGTHAEEES